MKPIAFVEPSAHCVTFRARSTSGTAPYVDTSTDASVSTPRARAVFCIDSRFGTTSIAFGRAHLHDIRQRAHLPYEGGFRPVGVRTLGKEAVLFLPVQRGQPVDRRARQDPFTQTFTREHCTERERDCRATLAPTAHPAVHVVVSPLARRAQRAAARGALLLHSHFPSVSTSMERRRP